MVKNKELVLYCLVPYNLSPIQQGIQAAHGVAELCLSTQGDKSKIEYGRLVRDWSINHKTIIVLNGGTTGKESSMESYKKDLDKLGVKYSEFREPDLNNALTAIAFVVDKIDETHVVGYLKQMRLA